MYQLNKLKSILRSVTTFGTLNDGNLMHTQKKLHLHNPRYFPSYLIIDLPERNSQHSVPFVIHITEYKNKKFCHIYNILIRAYSHCGYTSAVGTFVHADETTDLM
jgi:hypothetical protein